MDVVTSCTLDCPDMCSVRCAATGDEITLRGDPDHPVTRGLLCGKIRRYPLRLTDPARIVAPHLRDGEAFRAVSWDEALDVAADAVAKAAARDPRRVLLLRSAGSMGWSKKYVSYVFAELGARQTSGSLCSAVVDTALSADTGGQRQNDPREIAAAEAVVLWGKNPIASSIHTAAFVAEARAKGARVVAVTPDGESVRTMAGAVIRPRPGSDRFLALAVLKLFLQRIDRDVPWDRAAGADAFRDLLERHELDGLLDACDVPMDQAAGLADLYASTSSVATVLGWGLGRYEHGGENARAVHALAFLAGTLQRPGAGLFGGTDETRHVSAPQPSQRAPGPLIGRFGSDPSAGAADTDVIWITCANPVAQAPDGKRTKETLAAVPTVVVVDGFWTDTALCADVVLPTTLWLEEEDVVSSYSHAGLGAVRAVVAPPEGCRSDFAIVSELAGRLGVETPFPDLDAWLAACLPGGAARLAELRRLGWLMCDEPAVVWRDGFATADGRFHLLDRVTPDEAPDPEYPLVFLSLVRAGALNSQRVGSADEGLLPVRVNPATAGAAELDEGTEVRVESRDGAITGVLTLDPLLHPEACACPRGGWRMYGAAANDLTAPLLTDIGDTAAFYSTRVRIKPA